MQLTPVVVACVSAVTTVVPELIACVVSPLYEAVNVGRAPACAPDPAKQRIASSPGVGMVLALASGQLCAGKVPQLFVKPSVPVGSLAFFFNDTATTEIYTLSLHDALPICMQLTPVVVACVSAVTTVVPELIACVVSPLYEAVRSEERRVGKESRSRWSPYH